MPLLLVLPLILIGLGCWYILTEPQRKVDRLLRWLASEIGGTYHRYGIVGQVPSAQIPNIPQPWQLTIRPLGLLDPRVQVRWTIPWPKDNLTPNWDIPSQQLMLLGNPPANHRRHVSIELARSVAYFFQHPGFTDSRIRTQDGHFICEGTVFVDQSNRIGEWTRAVFSLSRTLAAESSAEIAFLQASIAPNSQVGECQICGQPVEESVRVQCAACGAPHHFECWQYNQGCAIFGCRTPYYVYHQTGVSARKN